MVNRIMFNPDSVDPTSSATIVSSLQQRGLTVNLGGGGTTYAAPVVSGTVRRLLLTTNYVGTNSGLIFPIPGAAPQIIHFGMRYSTTAAYNNWLNPWMLGDASVLHLYCQPNTDGSISVRRADNALLGTTASGLIPLNGSEFHLGTSVKIDDTTGFVRLYINGSTTPALDVSNVDTRNGGTATVTYLRLIATSDGGGGYVQHGMRDLYVNDSLGGVNDGLWGDAVITRLTPNSNISSGLTPSTGSDNAAIAGKTPWGTTSNLSSAVVGTADEYGLTDMPSVPANVYAVRVNALWDKSDSGSRGGAVGVNSGGTISDGADTALSTSAGVGTAVWETNPATGAAWTPAAVNALRARVKVSS